MPLRCTLLGLAWHREPLPGGVRWDRFRQFWRGRFVGPGRATTFISATMQRPTCRRATLSRISGVCSRIGPHDPPPRFRRQKEPRTRLHPRLQRFDLRLLLDLHVEPDRRRHRNNAIAQRDAEVRLSILIAQPDQSRHLSEFLAATFKRSVLDVSKTPFPVVLDIGLNAVDALGIRKDPSKPATYILDKRGQGALRIRRKCAFRPPIDQSHPAAARRGSSRNRAEAIAFIQKTVR